MTNRANPGPQDFKKMCQQAERDHESRKLVVLLDRVKQQIATRENPALTLELPKPPVGVFSGNSGLLRTPSRSAPFER